MKQKIKILFLMLLVAIMGASIFGIIHDQISYTISEEYFTQFKFKQFGVPWAYEHPRLGAIYIGFWATWWVGLIVWLFLGLFSLNFNTPTHMKKELSYSYVIAFSVAFCFSITGIVLGYYVVNENNVSNYNHWLWSGVKDPVQFVRVGYMHNASYIGGLVGMFTGLIFLTVKKYHYKKIEKDLTRS
jgi:hypothetical protein